MATEDPDRSVHYPWQVPAYLRERIDRACAWLVKDHGGGVYVSHLGTGVLGRPMAYHVNVSPNGIINVSRRDTRPQQRRRDLYDDCEGCGNSYVVLPALPHPTMPEHHATALVEATASIAVAHGLTVADWWPQTAPLRRKWVSIDLNGVHRSVRAASNAHYPDSGFPTRGRYRPGFVPIDAP